MLKTRILILGASGMLGHALLYAFINRPELIVRGTVRDIDKVARLLPSSCGEHIMGGVDAYRFDTVRNAIIDFYPQVVINCIGLIRHLPEGQKRLPCIEINARFPHLLLETCGQQGVQLIHISTDCVFDGKEDFYTEESAMSAKDVYGISKYLGELTDPPGLTLRTSIIGHEISNKVGLLEWFLAQDSTVNGYVDAMYSGVTTTELGRVIAEFVLPGHLTSGLYQVASAPISKFDLLTLVGKIYDSNVAVVPYNQVRDTKVLSGSKFQKATGYVAPPWSKMVAEMKASHFSFLEEVS